MTRSMRASSHFLLAIIRQVSRRPRIRVFGYAILAVDGDPILRGGPDDPDPAPNEIECRGGPSRITRTACTRNASNTGHDFCRVFRPARYLAKRATTGQHTLAIFGRRKPVRSFQKYGRGHFQRLGELFDDGDCGIPGSSLDVADIGAVDAGTIRKLFLTPALLVPEPLEVRPEALANIHSRSKTPLSIINLQTISDN